jgi:hypothetical protein
MAVLPKNQVTQREEVSIVGFSASASPIATSETAWHVTTDTTANDVVVTKAVAADQEDREVVDTRVTGTVATYTL